MSQDKSFNQLGSKFAKNIYGTGKGKIRQAVLMRDLLSTSQLKNELPLSILDIGGGQGQIAIELAKMGHHVTLIDISDEMVEIAKQNVADAGLTQRFSFVHCALQDLSVDSHAFDIVLCHAVFEWLDKPLDTFNLFKKWLKPNGVLSLMFFNLEAKRFANTIYGNFEYLDNNLAVKKRVKLSPNNPLQQQQVIDASREHGFTLLGKTGVRCVYDYMRDISMWEKRFDDILKQELILSKQEPYASLGRYIHLLLKSELK